MRMIFLQICAIIASGNRNNSNGSLNNVGSNGYVWSAAANSQNNAYYLYFNSSNVNPQNNNNRANGFSVRPVAALTLCNYNMKYTREDLDYMVYVAYLEARKNERNTKSQLEFEFNLEENLRNLREQLFKRTYKPSPAFCFMITKPSKREVFAPAFIDRVVSHVLFGILYPLFDSLFIEDSYSCRKNKGTLYGIQRFEHHLRSATNNFTKKCYVLTLDISGYFMSIDKYLLEQEIFKQINSHNWNIDKEFTKWLTSIIIYKTSVADCVVLGNPKDWENFPPHKSLFNSKPNKGLIIGDLTSQLFSNIYLNIFDQYIKHILKCKHYSRYVDDSRIIHENKQYLEKILDDIELFLITKLGLKINREKTKIISTWKRQEFLGAIILRHKRYATPRTLKNFALKVRYMESFPNNEANFGSLNSYLGYFQHFITNKTKRHLLDDSSLRNIFEFKDYNKVKYKL